MAFKTTPDPKARFLNVDIIISFDKMALETSWQLLLTAPSKERHMFNILFLWANSKFNKLKFL